MAGAPAPPPPLSATAYVMRRPSLYVGDLHPDTTEWDLEQLFFWIGALYSVRVCRDSVTKRSLCYAYVNFIYFSDALKAMTVLNHTNLRGKPMRIMWCQRDPLIRKSSVGNLFVKNLPPSVTSSHLERIFSNYGTILSCKVVVEDGISKCFGFVHFDSEQSAMFAIRCLNGRMFEGKKLYVSKFINQQARKLPCEGFQFTNLYVKNMDGYLIEELKREKFSKDGKNSQASTLHVKNLSESTDERKVRAIFSAYGKLIAVGIIHPGDGVNKGFGFVTFVNPRHAKKAMYFLDGTSCDGMCLHVALASSKEELGTLQRSMPCYWKGRTTFFRK